MIRSQALPSATSNVSDPADRTTREASGDGEGEQRQRRQVARPREEQGEDTSDEQPDRQSVPGGRSWSRATQAADSSVKSGRVQVETKFANQSTEPVSGCPPGPILNNE
jgi:hypothetical protein